MARRKENNSNKKIIILGVIIFVVAIIWLGTRDISNTTEKVTVDITEQVKG